jgi:hypothetical protein
MARQRVTGRRRPATSPEQREMQLADMAYDLAEEQMKQERMRHEVELMQVKKEQLEGQKRVEELYVNALEAMRGYSGLGPGDAVDGSLEED